MTPEQAQQVAARMTRQLADSPQLSTYLYTNARETFNRLRQQDQREQDARKQQNAPGFTIPGIPGLDLDLFRWWRGDPAHRS